ncbi:putative virion structural protein [Erwinia phage vB_EamM_MadMel]|uniref:Putative virion structural protein n=2 Tax=Agricanvirus specialG TaxID=1984781 RepID=A0A191ZBP9_9CAUD|nr:virion structural protein [Erwinia phage vB_EamM_Special G]ANJ64816.1 putative virion structural protein [Erwinia phage vB_EamM_Special G]AUG86434.1 putative virion structural protein [Erwinia phage vB_EamM_MadMel]
MAESNRLAGNSRAATPKLNLLNKDPATKAIIDILVPKDNKPRDTSKRTGRSNRDGGPSAGMLQNISKLTSTSIDSNTELMESVPGALKACKILTASILSPRNLRTVSLTYTTEAYEGKNTELNSLLISAVREYIEKNYKITDKLADIVPDMLFKTGSSAWAVLSQSSLDNVINGYTRGSGMEAIADDYDAHSQQFRSRGYLGNPGSSNMLMTASLESLMSGETPIMTMHHLNGDNKNELGLTITDNDAVLSLPRFKLALARHNLSKKNRIPLGLRRAGMEALEDKGGAKAKGGKDKDSKVAQTPVLTDEQYSNVYNDLFKQRDYVATNNITVGRDDELSKENVGQPLLMHLPSECVIPVHVPGDFKHRVGYFVLLDEHGNPVRTAQNDQFYQDQMKNRQDTNSAIDSTKGIIAMAAEMKSGNKCTFDTSAFYNKYVEEVEKDLVQRLANGTYGQTMTVGLTNEVMRIMFARTCRNLQTRILYLPEEAMTYFAFDYNRFGIGRSLLDRSRLYASMAMTNIIATTLANVANSVNITTLNIPLDEDDPEPENTIEDVITTHLNSTLGLSSIIGAKNPRDVCNILDSASVIVKTSGNDHYPSIDADISHGKRDITPPDPEWNDRLMEFLSQMWGIRPELISSQNDIKFAIEHINNDALYSQEITVSQRVVCGHASDLVRKLTAKSGNLMNELYDLIHNNKNLWSPSSAKGRKMFEDFKANNPDVAKDEDAIAARLLTNFINSIIVTLPEPETTDLEEITRAYQTRREHTEAVINDRFPDAVVGKFLDGSEEDLETWRQSLVAMYMRKWMDDSGNAQQYAILNDLGEDTNATAALLSEIISYNENVWEGILTYLKDKKKVEEKLQSKYDKLKEDEQLGDTAANPNAPPDEGEADPFAMPTPPTDGDEPPVDEQNPDDIQNPDDTTNPDDDDAADPSLEDPTDDDFNDDDSKNPKFTF